MEQNEPNRKFGRNKNYGNVVAGFKCNVVGIFISTQCILRQVVILNMLILKAFHKTFIHYVIGMPFEIDG